MTTSIYQDIILDHYRNPRHHGSLEHPTHQGDGINSSCGDKLHMDIRVEDDTIQEVRFQGVGCAISQASASLLTESIVGRPVAEVIRLTPGDVLKMLGVTLSPSRVKCGLLSLETLHKVLVQRQ